MSMNRDQKGHLIRHANVSEKELEETKINNIVISRVCSFKRANDDDSN